MRADALWSGDMGFLDWMKRGRKGGREPQPDDPPIEDRYFTKKGNPIRPVSAGEWTTDDGLHEFRVQVGRSVEGFHGGLEVSYRGGDGSVSWSNARSTPGAAERAAYGIQDWREGRVREKKAAPGRGQNEIRNPRELTGKDSRPAAKDKGHRWER